MIECTQKEYKEMPGLVTKNTKQTISLFSGGGWAARVYPKR